MYFNVLRRSVPFLFFGLMLFLAFNKHSRAGFYNYHSELWSDKAGYYVYLPAAFIYDFNPDFFPEAIDEKTGWGFRLEDKVKTKYTYGVALAQLPFFFIASGVAFFLEYDHDGFSPPFHWAINVASVFYLTLGIYFLYAYLRRRFSKKVTWMTLFSFIAGTNLYYYSIDETGMSHVYSFCLFASLLYLIGKTDLGKNTFWTLFTFICSFIVLIRPTNLLFIMACLVYETIDSKMFLNRISDLKSFFRWILIVSVAFFVFFPQFLYWKYISGSYFSYSYGEEGFNWFYPKLSHTWFAPDNGLFLYTPFALVILAGIVYMVQVKTLRWQGVLIGTLFLSLSYIFSCWWCTNFGCSFGARSFVEFYALFSIPIACLYNYLLMQKLKYTWFIWLLVAFCIFFNLKMSYVFDQCFFGDHTWDWVEYKKLLLGVLLF